jgi:hypothetical protein
LLSERLQLLLLNVRWVARLRDLALALYRLRGALPVMARSSAIMAVVLSLLLGSLTPAFAQSGGTSGNVNGSVLSDTGKPVSGATVTIASPSGSFNQKTDSHGYFAFLGVPADTYGISVSASGFAAYSQGGVTVTGGSTVSLGSVRLSTQLRTIGSTVSRSAFSAFQPNQTVPQFTISGSVLNAAAGKASNSNEAQILLAVPGFQQDYRGNLILQGATTDQIRYQFDGVDFTDPGFSASANQEFFNGISSVQVVPGAGNPSQGNGGAGVVNLLVKRGTYPPSGVFDVEANYRPFGQQINVQYGTATADGRFSDYISYFGNKGYFQYGPWGTNAFSNGAIYLNQRQGTSDFVNNFVTRFGPGNNQSFQILYLAHAYQDYGDYGGIPEYYDDYDPTILGNQSAFTGLTPAEVSSITAFDQGQTSVTQPVNALTGYGSTSLLKFEYDNQFNSSTSLNLRFFHSDVYDYTSPAASETALASVVPTYSQTSGGSRTGANFDLNIQAGERNTITFSGNYLFNHPNFGASDAVQNVLNYGPNNVDFLTPANPNAPVSATNPCPVAGGCYLQQFFYTTGGTPKVPPLTLNSVFPNLSYGAGIRDQIQVTNALRLDLGLRYDYFNQFLTPGYVESEDENTQPVPGNPGAYYLPNYGFVNHPHFLQPRLGLSYRITPDDSISLTYGKSINLAGNGLYASPLDLNFANQFLNVPVNPNYVAGPGFVLGNPGTAVGPGGTVLCNVNVPYAVGAGPNAAPDYKGSVGTTLQMGHQCANYAQVLVSELDDYFPELVNIQPAVLYSNDITYSHQFKNGVAFKVEGFNRQAYKVQLTTAPVIFDPATGTTSVGSLTSTTEGQNQTTGVSFFMTLPEKPYGFTGSLSATYINELTNTPAVGDNPYGQDFEPFAPAVYGAVNDGNPNIYRAGFVSPLTVHLGIAYKTKTGFRINPILNFNDGYPYNVGSTTPYFLGYGPSLNVPNTNITDAYSPATAPNFVDPANPGSVFAPNISASRGNKEGYAGSELSPPQATMDLTLEFTPPKAPRNTFGIQILDLFNNAYYNHAAPNPNYFPVSTGTSGPLTGQNPAYAVYPNLTPYIATNTYPYAPYVIAPYAGTAAVGSAENAFTNLPFTMRFYYQLKI